MPQFVFSKKNYSYFDDNLECSYSQYSERIPFFSIQIREKK